VLLLAALLFLGDANARGPGAGLTAPPTAAGALAPGTLLISASTVLCGATTLRAGRDTTGTSSLRGGASTVERESTVASACSLLSECMVRSLRADSPPPWPLRAESGTPAPRGVDDTGEGAAWRTLFAVAAAAAGRTGAAATRSNSLAADACSAAGVLPDLDASGPAEPDAAASAFANRRCAAACTAGCVSSSSSTASSSLSAAPHTWLPVRAMSVAPVLALLLLLLLALLRAEDNDVAVERAESPGRERSPAVEGRTD